MAFYVSTNPKYDDGSGGGGGGGEVTIVGGAVVLLAAAAQTRATNGNIFSGTIPANALADGDCIQIAGQFGLVADSATDYWTATVSIAGTPVVTADSQFITTAMNGGSYLYSGDKLYFYVEGPFSFGAPPIDFDASVDQPFTVAVVATGTPANDAYLGCIALIVIKKEVP